MLKQLVSDREILLLYILEFVYLIVVLLIKKHENNAKEDGVFITNRIAFDDYPSDELRVDENGAIGYSKLKIGYVKSVYIDSQIFLSTICHRLFNFLRVLIFFWLIDQDSKYKRMTILKMKYMQFFQMTREEPLDIGLDSTDCDESDLSDVSE